MKALTLSSIVVAALSLAGGCVHPQKPEFNQTYLPNTVPGAPQKTIDLTADITNKTAKKINLSGTKTLSTSLYWIEEDTLLFSIPAKDRDESLYSFLINPTSGHVRLLEDAEKNALWNQIKKNKLADKTGGPVAELAKFALQIAVALAGAGGGSSGSGSRYSGQIENNGFTLDIEAVVKRRKLSSFDSPYDCQYKLTNRQTGKTLKGKVQIEKEGKKQESVENWLKSWRISPDGRYYLIGATATLIDPEARDQQQTTITIIENYGFVALDVSPKWDKIALLVIKENEKTKQADYRIEFYPFYYSR